MSKKNDVDTAVLQTACGGGVAGYGVELGVTGGGEVGGAGVAVFEQQARDA